MEIQAKIESVRQELNAENQRGALKDSSKVTELEEQLKEMTNQLTPVVLLEESYFLDNVDADGIVIKDLFINFTQESANTAFAIVKGIVQAEIKRLQDPEQNGKTALNREVELLKKDVEIARNNEKTAESNYADLYEKFNENRGIINALSLNLEDMTLKRAAAVNELEEHKAESKLEIDRLEKQVSKLEEEIAIGAKNGKKVVPVDVAASIEEYKKQRQLAENAKPAIYDIQPLDNLRNRFTAKYAETDEVLEFGFMDKGLYREVTADEAPSFRREESQFSDADSQRDIVEEISELTPTFQSDESPVSGVDEGNTSVEVAIKTDKERIEALELAVFGQVRDVA